MERLEEWKMLLSNFSASEILKKIEKVKHSKLSTSKKIERIIALRKSLKEAVYDKKEQ